MSNMHRCCLAQGHEQHVKLFSRYGEHLPCVELLAPEACILNQKQRGPKESGQACKQVHRQNWPKTTAWLFSNAMAQGTTGQQHHASCFTHL